MEGHSTTNHNIFGNLEELDWNLTYDLFPHRRQHGVEGSFHRLRWPLGPHTTIINIYEILFTFSIAIKHAQHGSMGTWIKCLHIDFAGRMMQWFLGLRKLSCPSRPDTLTLMLPIFILLQSLVTGLKYLAPKTSLRFYSKSRHLWVDHILLLIFYRMLNNTLFHILKLFLFSYQYMWRCSFAWFCVIGCSFVS